MGTITITVPVLIFVLWTVACVFGGLLLGVWIGAQIQLEATRDDHRGNGRRAPTRGRRA